MKKKTIALIGSALCLVVGGITVLNLNGDNSIVEMFKSPRDKQLDYLKKHEQEIIEWIKKEYPKIELVQIDWDTLSVGPISNGVVITGYNLSIKGKFNNLDNTRLGVDFYLSQKDELPNIKKIGMLNHPMIDRGDMWVDYE